VSAEEHDVSAEEERVGALAGAILDLEAERQAEGEEQAHRPERELPGVGGDELVLGDALRIGGRFTLVVLALLVALDELASSALSTLAPDMARTIHATASAMVAMSAVSGLVVALASVPLGVLADRHRRGGIIGWASLVSSLLVLVAGVATTGLTILLARVGLGVARSDELPVQGSLLADQYPIGTRGRVWASLSMAGRLAVALSPLLVGGVAALAGGSHGWQWAFLVIAIPAAVVAVVAFRLPEPRRGQYEKQDLLDESVDDEDLEPISREAAYSQLIRIRTLRTSVLAFGAIGFGLFTVPLLASFFLRQHFGVGSFGRGLVVTLGALAALVTIPFVGRRYDHLYRADPAAAFRLFGLVVLPAAILTPVQYFMPNAVLFAVVGIPTAVLLSAAFAMVGPIVTSVVPYRLRGTGSALGAIYVSFVGVAGGGLLASALVSSYNPRAAVLVILVPATLFGGLLVLRRSAVITEDLVTMVGDAREEQDESRRQQAEPENLPALQVSHVDFSYGHVQVLFDISFEVRRGEVLALLGTNGAGKSTLLRVVAGLGAPSRGVVRLHGRSITYLSPEVRSRLAIHMLPGGNGVFRDMTVRENLEMAIYNYRADRSDMERRIEAALELFPELAPRTNELASALSGGQQQLLALARILACEPEILIIDELSLGLAPIMVERLVETILRLKEQGMTIIVVEQSLNVAMAIAERTVFIEKGQVRYEGPTAELVERSDLARAVFLGADG
jgi:ABC-type branched-subunit amino acid transport system ATPase component/predicted MFS family arabinose efflux permease